MPLKIYNVTPPSILRRQDHQETLNKEGIIQFPFLSGEALSALRELYADMHPVSPSGPIPGFYVSVHSEDLDYKLKVERELRKIVMPFCETYFKDYKWVTSAIQVKKAMSGSELGVHQDWSVVDESRFASYGLWIPLVDVNAENGPLFALKRSHRIGPTYRHTALPSVLSNLDDRLDRYYVPFSLKAGEAILFNQAMLHHSTANMSDRDRPSMVATIIPQSATLLMYARSAEENRLHAYAVKEDYLQHFRSFFKDSVAVPADAEKLNFTVSADFTPIEPEEFESLYLALMAET